MLGTICGSHIQYGISFFRLAHFLSPKKSFISGCYSTQVDCQDTVTILSEQLRWWVLLEDCASGPATGSAYAPRPGLHEGLQYRRIDRATGEELSPQIKGVDLHLGKLCRGMATNVVCGVVVRVRGEERDMIL